MSGGVIRGVAAALEYLHSQGWTVSRASFYGHQKAGKIRPDARGEYTARALDRYAKTFLAKRSTAPSVDLEELERGKLEAEARKMSAQADHWELRTAVDAGRYVDRSLVGMALAARASLLRADLEDHARQSAPGIVEAAGGDPERIPEVIEIMIAGINTALHRYAERMEIVRNDDGDMEEADE